MVSIRVAESWLWILIVGISRLLGLIGLNVHHESFACDEGFVSRTSVYSFKHSDAQSCFSGYCFPGIAISDRRYHPLSAFESLVIVEKLVASDHENAHFVFRECSHVREWLSSGDDQH